MAPTTIIGKIYNKVMLCEELPTVIHCYQLTVSTPNPSIFRVSTVMNANWTGRTVYKSSFTASARQVIQEDGSSSPAKEGI